MSLPVLKVGISICIIFIVGTSYLLFQHDGCPALYSRHVREYLNQTYPHRWIGRGGEILWPSRSPDLNPLDFFTRVYYIMKLIRIP